MGGQQHERVKRANELPRRTIKHVSADQSCQVLDCNIIGMEYIHPSEQPGVRFKVRRVAWQAL
jgi:hypothetical protein